MALLLIDILLPFKDSDKIRNPIRNYCIHVKQESSGLSGNSDFAQAYVDDSKDIETSYDELLLQNIHSDLPTPISQDIDDSAPSERSYQGVYRILRDTSLARKIKQVYNFECQICGQTIHLSNGERYAEAHHIRPLGNPHNGPDVAGNVICLCPNHHVMMDYGAIEIDLVKLRLHSNHILDLSHINYHNTKLYQRLIEE